MSVLPAHQSVGQQPVSDSEEKRRSHSARYVGVPVEPSIRGAGFPVPGPRLAGSAGILARCLGAYPESGVVPPSESRSKEDGPPISIPPVTTKVEADSLPGVMRVIDEQFWDRHVYHTLTVRQWALDLYVFDDHSEPCDPPPPLAIVHVVGGWQQLCQ